MDSVNKPLPYDPENTPFTPEWTVTEDLHTHTTASDGLLTPTKLVEQMARTNLKYAAVTDHDTVDGIEEAMTAAEHFSNLTIIPGIEISAHSPESDCHIIGLFIDYKKPELKSLTRKLQEDRTKSIQNTVNRLAEMGIVLEYSRIRELAAGTIGRPHIARAMMEKGYVANFKEAFDKYLADGKPAHIKRDGLSPLQALNLIANCGGVAILAHPRTVKQLETVLPKLVAGGLTGIEVYAEKYRNAHHRLYRSLAQKYDLIISGGSDYHANGNKTEVKPGDSGPPTGTTEALYKRALKIHGKHIGYKIVM